MNRVQASAFEVHLGHLTGNLKDVRACVSMCGGVGGRVYLPHSLTHFLSLSLSLSLSVSLFFFVFVALSLSLSLCLHNPDILGQGKPKQVRAHVQESLGELPHR